MSGINRVTASRRRIACPPWPCWLCRTYKLGHINRHSTRNKGLEYTCVLVHSATIFELVLKIDIPHTYNIWHEGQIRAYRALSRYNIISSESFVESFPHFSLSDRFSFPLDPALKFYQSMLIQSGELAMIYEQCRKRYENGHRQACAILKSLPSLPNMSSLSEVLFGCKNIQKQVAYCNIQPTKS